MPQPVDHIQKSRFEHIYDQYSSLLYGVILKILVNKNEAERILIRSFKLFFSQVSTPGNDKLVFSHLLKITIAIASEHVNMPKQEIGKIILKDLRKNVLQLTSVAAT